jgi:DNA-binding XRE family transcriptional regulator
MVRTRLAQVKVEKGVTQEELARLVGISLKSLTRLEQGRVPLPPLAWYVNCALALGCERLDEVLGGGEPGVAGARPAREAGAGGETGAEVGETRYLGSGEAGMRAEIVDDGHRSVGHR